jgi:hypothetical protein
MKVVNGWEYWTSVLVSTRVLEKRIVISETCVCLLYLTICERV